MGAATNLNFEAEIASLAQLFVEASAQADKLVEPQTRQVRLESATLRTEQDVPCWPGPRKRSAACPTK